MGRTIKDTIDKLNRLQNLFNFLYNVNIATSRQLYRATYSKLEDSYIDKNGRAIYREPRLFRQINNDDTKLLNEYTPFLGPKLYTAARGTQGFATFEDASPRNMSSMLGNIQQHSVAISSVVSQVYARPQYDALGLGMDYWNKARLQPFFFVGEPRFDKSWMQNPGKIDHDKINDEDTFNAWSNTAFQAIYESASYGDDLYTLTLPFNDWVISKFQDSYIMELKDDADQFHHPYIQMHDYRPDGVFLFKDVPDEDGALDETIAIEVELTGKSVESYIAKLAAYQSLLGQSVYTHVVYYCTRQRTINRINRALNILCKGNKENFNLNRQITCVLMNGDNNSLSQGGDLQVLKYENPVFKELFDPSMEMADIPMNYFNIAEKDMVPAVITEDMPMQPTSISTSDDIRKTRAKSRSIYLSADHKLGKLSDYKDWISALEDFIIDNGVTNVPAGRYPALDKHYMTPDGRVVIDKGKMPQHVTEALEKYKNRKSLEGKTKAERKAAERRRYQDSVKKVEQSYGNNPFTTYDGLAELEQ